MRKTMVTIFVLIVLGITLSACNQSNENGQDKYLKGFDGKIEHLHGIGFVGNAEKLAFATHEGLKFYDQGKWLETTKQNNDYMGFNAVDVGFYTSGHPGEGSKLPNPLGLMKSEDMGESLETLAFKGESDFHGMGVGYKNHVIYVLNEHENSKIGVGIYKSTDNADTWNKIKGEGLGKNIFSIAVHPTNDKYVAMAGQEGVFLSEDGGDTFNLLTENVQGTTVFMNEDELFLGTYGTKPELKIFHLNNQTEEQINIPEMKEDAVMYFVQNPQNAQEFVFVTFNNNGFITEDSGATWKQIIKGGHVQ